ncbi:hypothetical protein GQR58_014384 [Nymphon striatum]|nr:hypothetical protein GQR58_014384 [Nymphon striatum]
MIVVIVDQALYAKTAENAWKEVRFSNIVLRMRKFHTICDPPQQNEVEDIPFSPADFPIFNVLMAESTSILLISGIVSSSSSEKSFLRFIRDKVVAKDLFSDRLQVGFAFSAASFMSTVLECQKKEGIEERRSCGDGVGGGFRHRPSKQGMECWWEKRINSVWNFFLRRPKTLRLPVTSGILPTPITLEVGYNLLIGNTALTHVINFLLLDTGLKFETIHANPCTALPCKFPHGTSLEFDLEFKAQADYDLTDAYLVGFVELGDRKLEVVLEICGKLFNINGDEDGNPCTVNAGGEYKIQQTSKVFSFFPDSGAIESVHLVLCRPRPLDPSGEYHMESDVMVGDKSIGNYKAVFDNDDEYSKKRNQIFFCAFMCDLCFWIHPPSCISPFLYLHYFQEFKSQRLKINIKDIRKNRIFFNPKILQKKYVACFSPKMPHAFTFSEKRIVSSVATRAAPPDGEYSMAVEIIVGGESILNYAFNFRFFDSYQRCHLSNKIYDMMNPEIVIDHTFSPGTALSILAVLPLGSCEAERKGYREVVESLLPPIETLPESWDGQALFAKTASRVKQRLDCKTSDDQVTTLLYAKQNFGALRCTLATLIFVTVVLRLSVPLLQCHLHITAHRCFHFQSEHKQVRIDISNYHDNPLINSFKIKYMQKCAGEIFKQDARSDDIFGKIFL